MKRILAAVVFLAATAAQADPVTDDVRCFVASIQLLSVANDSIKMAAMMSHSYYMGKLSGLSAEDLEARTIAELDYMSSAPNLQKEAARCGEELKARGAMEKKIGDDIQKHAPQIDQQQNSK
jgi:hypothetical protein